MRRSVLVSLFAAVSLTLFGCATETDAGDEADQGDVAQSEDALALASLYGTWNAQAGGISTMTFSKDAASTGGFKGRRFDAVLEGGSVSGVYKVTHGTQLIFADVLGEYGLRLKGKTLTLTKKSDRTVVHSFEKAVLHSAAEMLAAAEAAVWRSRDPEYVYRTFTTRAAAEAWGNTQGGQWLARDGETAAAAKFVSGSNDLWSQELLVDKITLAITVTHEH